MTKQQIIVQRFVALQGTKKRSILERTIDMMYAFVKSKEKNKNIDLMKRINTEASRATKTKGEIKFSSTLMAEMKKEVGGKTDTKKQPQPTVAKKTPSSSSKTTTTKKQTSSNSRSRAKSIVNKNLKPINLSKEYTSKPLFNDRYFKKVLGDVERGYSCLIYGVAGSGKSRFLLDLSKYYASKRREKVAYVSTEQIHMQKGEYKAISSLQKAIREKNANNDNIQYFPDVPDLTGFSLCIIDSVTSAKFTPAQLRRVRGEYPNCDFVLVYHSTKQGKYKGSSENAHDPDVVLRCYKEMEGRGSSKKPTGRGMVEMEKNRFGEYGEVEIKYTN